MNEHAEYGEMTTPPTDNMSYDALLERMQELEEQVALQSIDRLTSVLSSDQFFGEVARILKDYPDQQFLMWRFDIDKFQSVNNLFGVEEGNRLLVYCSTYLKQSLPNNRSTAIGRMGGDVFCGITPYSDTAIHSGADGFQWRTASSTIASMDTFFKGFRDDFRFGVSIGFYQIEDHQEPLEIMYSRALAASKACKDNSERIYAFYDRALNDKMKETQLITAEMHAALEHGEFSVFLQPKVRLSDLSLVGAEALVRWIHPKRGRIPPDSFIPIFEENGFITKLDLYVLRRCCAYIQSWMRQGLNLIPLSVNLSQMDLSTPGLPSKIMAVLEDYKVAAKYIHLEITESAYADDVEQVHGVTQAFKDLGFHLEMDDFGKGYSSLNMIAELPIDTLKLDMGFLQGDYQGSSGKVIRFVTGLARQMDLVTVAEGIETQEQLAFLRSINCDCGQGYLFSRPLPKADFDAYMRRCAIASTSAPKVKHVDKTVAEYKGWNTQDIWEADSSFSTLFNTFPGGIGVCELNVLHGTFRLARYNTPFTEALKTTHETLKHYCDNLTDFIHPQDLASIRNALTRISDPKEWAKDQGTQSMDLRLHVLTAETTTPPTLLHARYTWVRLHWRLADFTQDTRTYIVQIDNVDTQYDALHDMEQRLTKVDELERQMHIYTNAGTAGTATLFFDYSERESNGEVRYANPQFFALFSLTDEIKTVNFPLPFTYFLCMEDAEKLKQFLREAVSGSETQFEWVRTVTDTKGNAHNTITNGRITRRAEGIFVDIVLASVSELSSLQEQLDSTQERSASILNCVEISYLDFQGGRVHWGHDMQTLFGLPEEDTLPTNDVVPASHIFHPDSLDAVGQVLKELGEKEGTRSLDCWLHHENYVDYTLRSMVFYSTCDSQGKVDRIFIVGKDISFARFQKSNVTLAEIAIHTPDGVLVFDCESGKLLFANEKYYNIIGITKEQMEQDFKNYPLLLICDEISDPVDILPEIATGEGASFTRISQLKNHSMRWVAFHGVRRGAFIYATVRDFTERQTLEIQLQREMCFNEILNSIADELLFQVTIPDKTITFRGKNATTFGVTGTVYDITSSSLLAQVIAPDSVDSFQKMVRDILSGVENTHTIQMIDNTGTLSWYRFEYRVTQDALDPVFAVGKAVNIDYEVCLLAKLERDVLTGCYNATAMKLRANQILGTTFPSEEACSQETTSAHAMLVIHIDNYEALSLALPASQCEILIKNMSQFINCKFRESDLVGRISDDQFVVFMQHVTIPSLPLEKVADLYRDFASQTTVDKDMPSLAISIRCGYASRDGRDYHTLLEQAHLVPQDSGTTEESRESGQV